MAWAWTERTEGLSGQLTLLLLCTAHCKSFASFKCNSFGKFFADFWRMSFRVGLPSSLVSSKTDFLSLSARAYIRSLFATAALLFSPPELWDTRVLFGVLLFLVGTLVPARLSEEVRGIEIVSWRRAALFCLCCDDDECFIDWLLLLAFNYISDSGTRELDQIKVVRNWSYYRIQEVKTDLYPLVFKVAIKFNSNDN